jgi:hypothetical protein
MGILEGELDSIARLFCIWVVVTPGEIVVIFCIISPPLSLIRFFATRLMVAGKTLKGWPDVALFKRA